MLKKSQFLIFLTILYIFTFMLVEKSWNCYNWFIQERDFERKGLKSISKSTAHILCAVYFGDDKFLFLVFIIYNFNGYIFNIYRQYSALVTNYFFWMFVFFAYVFRCFFKTRFTNITDYVFKFLFIQK